MKHSRRGKAWSAAASAASTAVSAARAWSGDVKAAAALGWKALRNAPRAVRWCVAVLPLAVFVALAGAGQLTSAVNRRPAGVEAASGAFFGAPPPVWAAYQIAGHRVVCLPGQPGSAGVFLDGGEPPGWTRVDWRLVAAVGQASDGSAGVFINGFGDMDPTVSDRAEASDTDRGRFDLDAGADRRAGPLRMLPSVVVSHGQDGNFDGISDPHNIFDAAATAAAFLCEHQAAYDPKGALTAWYGAGGRRVNQALAAWTDITAGSLPAPGLVPSGAPLAAYPPEAHPGLPADPVLAAVLKRLSSDPGAEEIKCSHGRCGWFLGASVPGLAGWSGLLEAGLAAPAAVHGWGVTSWGDASRTGRLPVRFPDAELTWPFPVSPPPQPDGASPPGWWTFHAPPAAWTTPGGPMVEIPAAPGAAVYSPSAGALTRTPGDGLDCVDVTDPDGGVWTLCGLRVRAGKGSPVPMSAPLAALMGRWGEMAAAADLPPGASLVSLGTFSCRHIAGSESWSQHSWNNAVDIAVDSDGRPGRSVEDMSSEVSYTALIKVRNWLLRQIGGPPPKPQKDGSTVYTGQAGNPLGIRNVIFNDSYRPGEPVSVVRHDEHIHVDFWPRKTGDPDCAPETGVAAGELIGVAYGTVTVTVTAPGGDPLCPQTLFAAWAEDDPLTPAVLEANLEAAAEEAAAAAGGGTALEEPETGVDPPAGPGADPGGEGEEMTCDG